MAKVQGDFGSASSGQRAVDALVASGVPRDRIRVWNLIPDNGPSASPGSAMTGGALAGLAFDGARGLVGGALIGGALDEGSQEGPNMPSPSGVRVVVDVSDDGDAVRDTLAACGAENTYALA